MENRKTEDRGGENRKESEKKSVEIDKHTYSHENCAIEPGLPTAPPWNLPQFQ